MICKNARSKPVIASATTGVARIIPSAKTISVSMRVLIITGMSPNIVVTIPTIANAAAIPLAASKDKPVANRNRPAPIKAAPAPIRNIDAPKPSKVGTRGVSNNPARPRTTNMPTSASKAIPISARPMLPSVCITPANTHKAPAATRSAALPARVPDIA